MPYFYLFLAIVGELFGTTFLKSSHGFTVLLPSLGVVASYGFCFFFFSKALLSVNLSVAYATWCGIGVVAAALISALIFKEAISFWGVVGMIFVVVGVVIMNLFGTTH